ncbi:hypothetical protein SLEP1_g5369 [Rubroshorea leprosula]|uniref:Uncharacterized protein n=1 Tax=Rubroshorea leprosula TaxID=152421 RepID=A0AAV5HS10_9ROSI|nr:hypothetical protein SLEP1_g5369 [Rubroshorea leprosula]
MKAIRTRSLKWLHRLESLLDVTFKRNLTYLLPTKGVNGKTKLDILVRVMEGVSMRKGIKLLKVQVDKGLDTINKINPSVIKVFESYNMIIGPMLKGSHMEIFGVMITVLDPLKSRLHESQVFLRFKDELILLTTLRQFHDMTFIVHALLLKVIIIHRASSYNQTGCPALFSTIKFTYGNEDKDDPLELWLFSKRLAPTTRSIVPSLPLRSIDLGSECRNPETGVEQRGEFTPSVMRGMGWDLLFS